MSLTISLSHAAFSAIIYLFSRLITLKTSNEQTFVKRLQQAMADTGLSRKQPLFSGDPLVCLTLGVLCPGTEGMKPASIYRK